MRHAYALQLIYALGHCLEPLANGRLNALFTGLLHTLLALCLHPVVHRATRAVLHEDEEFHSAHQKNVRHLRKEWRQGARLSLVVATAYKAHNAH